jgi:hypothetical protein
MENMHNLLAVAPGNEITDYDRRHLSLYAALLDAEAAGSDWRDVAATLMKLDPGDAGSRACWQSHLARAHWIVGDGLANAVVAFGEPGVLPER